MNRLTALAFFLFAAPAVAQDVIHIGPEMMPQERKTTVTLQPTNEPGAVAEVVFDNRDVNSSRDNGAYPLSIPGVSIEVIFRWTVDADSIEIVTQDGFYAVPAILDMAEGTIGTALIFSGQWEGM